MESVLGYSRRFLLLHATKRICEYCKLFQWDLHGAKPFATGICSRQWQTIVILFDVTEMSLVILRSSVYTAYVCMYIEHCGVYWINCDNKLSAKKYEINAKTQISSYLLF